MPDRALVALSEDQSLLSMLIEGTWSVFKVKWGDWPEVCLSAIDPDTEIPDTGQSAEDVLREWLEGRG